MVKESETTVSEFPRGTRFLVPSGIVTLVVPLLVLVLLPLVQLFHGPPPPISPPAIVGKVPLPPDNAGVGVGGTADLEHSLDHEDEDEAEKSRREEDGRVVRHLLEERRER